MRKPAVPLAAVVLATVMPLHAQEKKDPGPGSGVYKA
jgi:hypothetical protein